MGFKPGIDPVEGTDILSTGESGGSKFLREDGDGTCSWQTVSGGSSRSVAGDTDNAVITWVTSDNTFAAEANLTFSAVTNVLSVVGNLSASLGISGSSFYGPDSGAKMISAGDITLDAGSNVILDSATGIIDFQDAGSSILSFTEGNSGDVTVKLVTNGKDLIFTDNGDAETFRIRDAAAGVNVAGQMSASTGIVGSSVGANINVSGSYLEAGYLNINAKTMVPIDAGTENTVFGRSGSLGSGNEYNVVIGEHAGNALSTGDSNVVIGNKAGQTTTDVDKSVLIGASAAGSVMTADADGTVAIGYNAGASLTQGQFNVAIGHGALDAENLGNGSTAIGYNALTSQVSNQGGGDFGDANHNMNTAIGAKAAEAVTTGLWNTAVGSHALNAEVDGDGSTAIGTFALYAQTGTDGEAGNTALGYFAGRSLTTGKKNVFIGKNCADNTTDVDQTVIIGYGAGGANMTSAADSTVAIGYDALASNTTGNGNVAIGYQALTTNVDGSKNTAVGWQALETFEAGSSGDGSNTAVGYDAGQAVSTGTGNTILGAAAGDALQGGDDNTFVGRDAGGATTAAGELVIIGAGAGAAVMTADANGTIAIGKDAGAAITSGIGNTIVGYSALDSEDDGDQNTAVGYKALATQAGTSGEVGNTAIGYQAGQFITTATGCTFVGNQAGQGVGATKLTGNNNTGLGSDAGLLLRGAAHSNTFIGATAGDVTTTGVENTCLGFNADIQDATATNQVVIGNNITGTKDNAVFIGNDSSHIENDFNSDATWNHSSDVRQKTNIQDDTLGLDFISNLRTVTYNHKSPSEFPKEWTAYDPEDTTPMGGGKTIHGFIAQEVKEALDIAGCETFGGWSVDPDGRQRVSFEAFVMPLIKAVQELTERVKELEDK